MIAKIGDKIRIIHLIDEPFDSDYIGKVGEITHINSDCYGEVRYGGTWGSIFVYANKDSYEIIK